MYVCIYCERRGFPAQNLKQFLSRHTCFQLNCLLRRKPRSARTTYAYVCVRACLCACAVEGQSTWREREGPSKVKRPSWGVSTVCTAAVETNVGTSYASPLSKQLQLLASGRKRPLGVCLAVCRNKRLLRTVVSPPSKQLQLFAGGTMSKQKLNDRPSWGVSTYDMTKRRTSTCMLLISYPLPRNSSKAAAAAVDDQAIL